MKKILVAGAAGFTGKAVVDVLSPHYELRLFDLKPIPDGPNVIQGDLADYDAVKGAMAGVDAVVNAMMAPNETYITPVIPFQSNVLGTANLLEAAREAGVKRFVHLSTTAIFAAANLTYLDIDSTPVPSGMYSLTKYLQEVLCHNYVLVHGFSIACLRIAGGIVCGRTASYKEGKPLGKGEYSEGWICRYDIAEACRLALLSNDISFEIFYIGSTPELFARVNIQRTVERLGWRPVYDFQDYR
jgi:nucleoside-diphosphate-sugar epimerase